MEIKERIRQETEKVFRNLGGERVEVTFEKPKEEHGDLSTNAALIFFKKSKRKKEFKTPFAWAEAVAEELNKQADDLLLARVEAVNGFINFYFSSAYLEEVLCQVLRKKDKFGSSVLGKGKTVVIDYSSPNIAKPFGVGHLRSTIIGQALCNLYRFLGYRVIGDNHLGDWGTQFGKLIYQIEKKRLDVSNLTIEDLEQLYVEFHRQSEKNPEMEEAARECFKRLEEGDKKARFIWQALVNLSLKEFERVYKLLGVSFDVVLGESFYQDKMTIVVDEARRKKLLKKSRGALVIPLEGMEVPAMLVKSDGATTYLLRDLAALRYRLKRWRPQLVIYEVGADQRFYFRQLFLAAEKLGYFSKDQLVHVAHGMVRGLKGKFSTRQGKTIHLETVLKEAIKKAALVAGEAGISKDIPASERKKVLQMVGIGAVKYNDLKQKPTTDVIFDWEKMLSLKGNSGPYLQYTVVRAQGILAKAGGLRMEKIREYSPNDDELAILRFICQFGDVVSSAAHSFSPNLLANYLFSLAQKYNHFYDHYPVLQASSEKEKTFRLQLTAAVNYVLKSGLHLLGIETPEKM